MDGASLSGRRRLAAFVGAVLTVAALAGCSGGAAPDDEARLLGEILSDSHAHSLMADRSDPGRLWLGIHGGLYRSDDGRSWRLAALSGEDAMNLASAEDTAPLWVAGHDVLERSSDGGSTFEAVRPSGLPNLDLHGFAVRPGHPREIFAAAAGEGLYRSTDGGNTFELASREIGPSVFGMALTPDGALYAADPERGLLRSRDGGRTFEELLSGPGLVSVAVDSARAELVVAGGESGIWASEDGGRTFSRRFSAGAAPVAWATHEPGVAYAVGVDARLYQSAKGSRRFAPVEAGVSS